MLLGCGGAIDTSLLDGGSNDGSSKDVQSGKDAGANCQALLADLATKQEAATQCCPTCNSLQCTQQVEGLCCPLTVTSGDSLSVKAYVSAREAVKSANCQVNCPPITCSSKPSNVCQQNGACAQ